MRIPRLVRPDTRLTMALLASMLLFAAGAATLNHYVGANLLHEDAEATSRAWARSVLARLDDLQAIVAGRHPSKKSMALFRQVRDMGEVYRFKIWNGTGNLMFVSDAMGAPMQAMTIAGRHGAVVAKRILAGSVFIEAARGSPPYNPGYFSETYLPVVRDGAVLGVIEVYVDQTAKQALYRRDFRTTAGIVALLVLLSGGLPAFIVRRKMRAHREAEGRALFLAMHDPLTGLANRDRLAVAARGALAQARRHGGYVAALVIDLDRFKDINDSFGHGTGDGLLCTVAERLGSAIRDVDMVARLGGDEFVVLQVGLTQPNGATDLAERLIGRLSEPYDVDGQQLLCGASIGVGIAPSDAAGWEELLANADTALYRAKAAGRNGICFFEPGMDAAMRRRRQLEQDLRRALADETFTLAYQPLYDFADGRLIGFEALLRWPPGGAEVSPAEFIPIAEETGLIVPIGAWVLQTACRVAAGWERPLKVSVNLSPVQFRHFSIVPTVVAALNASGLAPACLELEVTEGLLLQNTDAVLEQLSALRAMGISIALDDFGTGYSSLSYLWQFQFDKVKVDRSFVLRMKADPKAAAIIDTIIGLGRTLNLLVTAEGVETEAQAEMLSAAGCDQGQGFLLGRPLTAAEVGELVRAGTAATAILLVGTSVDERRQGRRSESTEAAGQDVPT